MNISQLMESLTTNQRIAVKVQLGRGCRSVTSCADGGVICQMPGKDEKHPGEIIVIPRNKHRAPRLRCLVLIAGVIAGVYGLCATSFTGHLGVSHVMYGAFYLGAFIGLFSEWPRTISEQRGMLRYIVMMVGTLGLVELRAASRAMDDNNQATRGLKR